MPECKKENPNYKNNNVYKISPINFEDNFLDSSENAEFHIFPSGNYRVIDGELCRIVSDIPPNEIRKTINNKMNSKDSLMEGFTLNGIMFERRVYEKDFDCFSCFGRTCRSS